MAPPADVAPSRVPAGKDMLVIEDLTYTPPGATRPLLRDVELVLRGPERVALVGPNGSGKSTLLRLCVGELAPDRGSVRRGTGPPLLLLDEPTNHLDLRSLEVVERAIAEFDGALLVASHDRDLLAAAGVDRVVELGGTRGTSAPFASIRTALRSGSRPGP